jgi:hypothetical protein
MNNRGFDAHDFQMAMTAVEFLIERFEHERETCRSAAKLSTAGGIRHLRAANKKAERAHQQEEVWLAAGNVAMQVYNSLAQCAVELEEEGVAR